MKEEEEINDEFNISIKYIKAMETLVKSSYEPFDIHVERIKKLQYLARRIATLRDFEIYELKNKQTNGDVDVRD